MSLKNYRLQWEIYDPFLPGRDVEAAFYLECPTLTQWKATVRPMDRSPNSQEFLFSLESDTKGDHRVEIVVRCLLVEILLDGTEIKKNDVYDRRFSVDNQFRYDFQCRATIFPQTEPHCLEVVMYIYLEEEKEEEGRSGISIVKYEHFHEDDLRCLSRNLNLLLRYPQYSDMELIPNNSQQSTRVHSYIIKARWNNFFDLHGLEQRMRDRVRTNITRAVLLDILTYMYSGTIGITSPDWTNPEYTTELLQVINRYELYHLYKALMKNDLMQFRVTKNSGFTACHHFPLQFTADRKVIDDSCTLLVGSDNKWFLIFNMHVSKILGLHMNPNRDDPWLVYTLESQSSSRLYAKVNLALAIQVDNGPTTTFPFHEQDFSIEPFATVGSQKELLLGNPETLSPTDFSEIKYFIQCFFNVSDGATVEQIGNTVDDTKLNELASFGVLSDHMHLLKEQSVSGDGMQVLCRLEGHTNFWLHYQNVHKGIFAVRVPAWWQGLENELPSINLPDIYMTPTLSQGSLPIVLDYIYTGKMFQCPYLYLNEVQEFARRTGFLSLLNSADRVSLPLRD